jgi:hypothetical protein
MQQTKNDVACPTPKKRISKAPWQDEDIMKQDLHIPSAASTPLHKSSLENDVSDQVFEGETFVDVIVPVNVSMLV